MAANEEKTADVVPTENERGYAKLLELSLRDAPSALHARTLLAKALAAHRLATQSALAAAPKREVTPQSDKAMRALWELVADGVASGELHRRDFEAALDAVFAQRTAPGIVVTPEIAQRVCYAAFNDKDSPGGEWPHTTAVLQEIFSCCPEPVADVDGAYLAFKQSQALGLPEKECVADALRAVRSEPAQQPIGAEYILRELERKYCIEGDYCSAEHAVVEAMARLAAAAARRPEPVALRELAEDAAMVDRFRGGQYIGNFPLLIAAYDRLADRVRELETKRRNLQALGSSMDGTIGNLTARVAQLEAARERVRMAAEHIPEAGSIRAILREP